MTPDEIVTAAMQDMEIEGLKYPEQYLYNAIKCIKFDFRREFISKETASSMKTYARQVDYVSLKQDEAEHDELYRMVLDICHCVDANDMLGIKNILYSHNLKAGEVQIKIE